MHNADFEVGTFPGNVLFRKRNYAAGFRFVYCGRLSFSGINARIILKFSV